MRRIAALACLPAFVVGGLFASPAEASSAPTGAEACRDFAKASAVGDWMCVGDVLTDKRAGGQALVVDVARSNRVTVRDVRRMSAVEQSAIARLVADGAGEASPRPAFRTQAVVDDYHANRSTTFYYGTGSTVKGSVKFEHRVSLYNHSATDKQNVTMSQTGGDLYWTLRIRRDNNLSGDDTVFTYPDRQSCQSAGTTCSRTEDRYGDGYNRFPYDGKKYFLDALSWNLYIGGTTYLNIGGSAQSDRATCYKTTSCKFVG